MRKRKYTLRKRADRQAETRRRIVEATMRLHEEVGMASTTVSAIAERAGVERLTVYRHFPDQSELFRACSSHFIETTPPPDPESWKAIENPVVRTRAALESFYEYYGRTEAMWISVHRDLENIEALAEATTGFQELVDGVRDDLVRCWKPARPHRKTVRGLLSHALDFQTWRSMRAREFRNPKIAELMTSWIEATG